MLLNSLSAPPVQRSNSASPHYRAKLSGPFLDRIDLQVEVPVLPPRALLAAADGERTAVVAVRVALARERALARQGCVNAALAAADLETRVNAEPAALALLNKTAAQLGWSGRSLHRVLRVARTIADLSGSERITPAQMAEAAQLRRGLLQA